MPRKIIDLTGQKFGRLTVVRRDGSNKHKKAIWFCKCDCGNEKRVTTGNLKSGGVRSCGCLQIEIRTRHSKSDTLEYYIWSQMIQRCENPKNKHYKDYGQRGISVCERWHNFKNFYADMGDKPSPKLSLDRIDVNGNYEPSNCKWSTPLEQTLNRRVNKNNSSGFAGVSWVKRSKKWIARIRVDRESIQLGSFENKEDAIKARKQAELKYWNKQPS
jgi:hypothetical protein